MANQNPDLDHLIKDAGLDQELTEAFSPGLVKAAAVGILLKVGQLRQNVLHDRTAGTADKSIANMVFFLAGLVSVMIGSISSDADLLRRAKR